MEKLCHSAKVSVLRCVIILFLPLILPPKINVNTQWIELFPLTLIFFWVYSTDQLFFIQYPGGIINPFSKGQEYYSYEKSLYWCFLGFPSLFNTASVLLFWITTINNHRNSGWCLWRTYYVLTKCDKRTWLRTLKGLCFGFPWQSHSRFFPRFLDNSNSSLLLQYWIPPVQSQACFSWPMYENLSS